jgi:hypothetical protein
MGACFAQLHGEHQIPICSPENISGPEKERNEQNNYVECRMYFLTPDAYSGLTIIN